MNSASRADRVGRTATSRSGRLIILGTVIGFIAAVLIVLATAILVAGIAALVRTSMPGPAEDWGQPENVRRAGLGLVGALTVSGAVAGFLAALTRATDLADRRALVTCLGAAASWAMVTLAIASSTPSVSADAPPLVNTAIGLTIVGLGGGALAAVALWPSVVRAVAARRNRGLVRSAWAGARRVAAFGFALITILAAAPLLLFGLAGVLRGLMGDLPRSGWGAVAAMVVGSVVALGAGVLGLRMAGVPREWPSAPGGQVDAGRREDQ